MASSELSIEEIHEYFLKKGGTVSNREVVKYFKKYLTDPESKEDARIKFKRYINTLATTRTDGNEKFLILRPQYANTASPSPQSSSLGIPASPTYSMKDFIPSSPSSPAVRQPPPYRPPPPVVPSPTVSLDNISLSSSNLSLEGVAAPQAPPRQRGSRGGSRPDRDVQGTSVEKISVEEEEDSSADKENIDKQPISVKERTQKFNRLASIEDELSPRQQKERKKAQEKGADEDDGASVTSLDQKKCTEWFVTAAKGDYQELAKLASDEPRLVKLRDQPNLPHAEHIQFFFKDYAKSYLKI